MIAGVDFFCVTRLRFRRHSGAVVNAKAQSACAVTIEPGISKLLGVNAR